MSFQETSRDIQLQGHVLKAYCQKKNGDFVPSQLDLDSCIGNIDGHFEWGQRDYSKSARDVGLDDLGKVMLRAELQKKDGVEYEGAILDLSDKIENDDGHLRYQDRIY